MPNFPVVFSQSFFPCQSYQTSSYSKLSHWQRFIYKLIFSRQYRENYSLESNETHGHKIRIRIKKRSWYCLQTFRDDIWYSAYLWLIPFWINQLLSITPKILISFDNGDEYRNAFLDTSKAFDNVWHKRDLLNILRD